MKIEGIIWLRDIVEKLAVKHHVRVEEVKEVFENRPEFRFVEKGERAGEDLYLALGRTDVGRYLTVLFIYKRKAKEALVVSAREMARKERKHYGRE